MDAAQSLLFCGLPGIFQNGNLQKERREYDKKRKSISQGNGRIYDPVCHCSGCECNAHYGGVSSGGILCDMGHYLSAVSCGRIDFPEKKSKRKSKDDHADRHVRRVYFRDLVFKDPVGHRKLFP